MKLGNYKDNDVELCRTTNDRVSRQTAEALLASYLVQKQDGQTLEQYLETEIFADVKRTTLAPDPEDEAGFDRYLSWYRSALAAENAAVKAF